MTAGAYGAVMSSTYNSRLLVPEVLVAGDRFDVIRARPSYQALLSLDTIPPWLEGSPPEPPEARRRMTAAGKSPRARGLGLQRGCASLASRCYGRRVGRPAGRRSRFSAYFSPRAVRFIAACSRAAFHAAILLAFGAGFLLALAMAFRD